MNEHRHNWLEEKRSAYLYRAIAQYEPNQVHASLFLKLADAADHQAQIWQEKAKNNGDTANWHFKPSLRTQIIIWLTSVLGPKAAKNILAAIKVRGMSIYNLEEQNEATAAQIINPEKHHHPIASGNNLRAAIFGVNDGLVSNASLILGMAGAQTNSHFIVVAGIAGLLAGAFSMGAGEYISVRSQREMLEYQINIEKEELDQYPEEEATELAMIYAARGIPHDDAVSLANKIIQDPAKALNILAKEELGLDPSDLVSPWGASISSFCSFTLGALIPLLPFLLFKTDYNLLISIGLSVCSLFGVGAAMSLFTGKNAFFSGTRMLLIGSAAGLITYIIGHMLNGTVGL